MLEGDRGAGKRPRVAGASAAKGQKVGRNGVEGSFFFVCWLSLSSEDEYGAINEMRMNCIAESNLY